MSFESKDGGVCGVSGVSAVSGACGVSEPGEALNQKLEPELDETLRDFRLSIHAWSDAALSRPRAAVEPGRSRRWKLATVWALGCVLVVGGVSTGGVYEHHQREMGIAAARAAEQQRQAAQERARQEEEDLLAKVDSDVSREVPSAMEPLAQLMAGDETQ
jgi:hypothetical protein